MSPADAIAWLEDLIERRQRLSERPSEMGGSYFAPYEDLIAWLAEIESALQALLPEGHALRGRWRDSVSQSDQASNVQRATAVLRTTHGLFTSGRLRSLVDGIRAETVAELIDQADALLAKGYLPAAATLAGGALETHLRHLCDRAGLAPSQHSISGYQQALAKERKAGREIISTHDGKSITGWGGLRNEAAHEPGKFAKERSKDQIRLFIEGVRQFVGRNP